ncbi:MAG: hypothetical protein CMM25_06580 [Rhodospirillaceae bacterium]|nr:hypothetical protein [Rhodospirillaceae bacterium]
MVNEKNNNMILLQKAAASFHKGDVRTCINICTQLLPTNITGHTVQHLLALSHRTLKELEKAEYYISQAYKNNPNNITIANSYGLILMDQKKLSEAQKLFSKAIRIDKSYAAAHTNLGHTYNQLGFKIKAKKSYTRALALNPKLPDAITHLALNLRSEGLFKQAKLKLLKGLMHFPNEPGILMVSGLLEIDDKNFKEAERIFKTALTTQPKNALLWCNFGLALQKQNKAELAFEAYQTAINLDQTLQEALLNIADLLKYDKPIESRKYIERLIELDLHNKIAHDMLGFTYFIEGKPQPALVHFRTALKLDPHYEQAAFHAAAALFIQGELAEAWEKYELKYAKPTSDQNYMEKSFVAFNTGDIITEKIIIWTDQGVGDEILQLGMVPDALQIFKKVVLITSSRLVPLAKRSFTDAICLSNGDKDSHLQLKKKEYKQMPAIKLGRICRTSLDKFPQRVSYLQSDSLEQKKLYNKYRKRSSKRNLLIGLSWRSLNAEFGTSKSLCLTDLMPILKLPHITFVNLQYGDTKADLALLSEGLQNRIITDPTVDQLTDMDKFASQVSTLDMVVTISNTAAHLAGSLGIKTLIMVPKIGRGWLWYWFNNRNDSPWYPKMEIYRQPLTGSWAPTINRIAEDIKSYK